MDMEDVREPAAALEVGSEAGIAGPGPSFGLDRGMGIAGRDTRKKKTGA